MKLQICRVNQHYTQNDITVSCDVLDVVPTAVAISLLDGVRHVHVGCERFWLTFERGSVVEARPWTKFYFVPAPGDGSRPDYDEVVQLFSLLDSAVSYGKVKFEPRHSKGEWTPSCDESRYV